MLAQILHRISAIIRPQIRSAHAIRLPAERIIPRRRQHRQSRGPEDDDVLLSGGVRELRLQGLRDEQGGGVVEPVRPELDRACLLRVLGGVADEARFLVRAEDVHVMRRFAGLQADCVYVQILREAVPVSGSEMPRLSLARKPLILDALQMQGIPSQYQSLKVASSSRPWQAARTAL